MIRSIFPLILAAWAASLPAPAQHMNEKDSPCVDVAVTADLVSCLARARAAAEIQLNAVYARVRGKLDSAEAQQLATAQRLWIQYRDANCGAERDLYGDGTGRNPAYLACLEAMTRARIEELKVTYAVRLK